jgi:hypothetical protein
VLGAQLVDFKMQCGFAALQQMGKAVRAEFLYVFVRVLRASICKTLTETPVCPNRLMARLAAFWPAASES